VGKPTSSIEKQGPRESGKTDKTGKWGDEAAILVANPPLRWGKPSGGVYGLGFAVYAEVVFFRAIRG
jgi:hypothetical protein